MELDKLDLLRDYQVEAVTATWDHFFSNGHRSGLGKMATGGGKTRVMGALAYNLMLMDKRILFLVDTRELVKQAAESFWETFKIGGDYELAEHHARKGAKIVFSTRQSMERRLTKYDRMHFDFIFIDEAHTVSASYEKIIQRFVSAKVLGVTATDYRASNCLFDVFERSAASRTGLVFDVRYDRLVREGYLSPITVIKAPLKIDLTGVSTVGGDYNAKELSTRIEPYLELACDTLKEHAIDRRTLAYFPSRRVARKFCGIATDRGLKFAYVDANTASGDLRAIIRQLEEQEIDGIANVMLLTKGTDIPSADCLLNLRPTKSWSLFVQIAGRITRTFPGKLDGLYIDPLFVTEQHNLLRKPSQVFNDPNEEESERAKGEGEERVSGPRGETLVERLREVEKRKKEIISAEDFLMQIGDFSNFQLTDGSYKVPLKYRPKLRDAGIDWKTVAGPQQLEAIMSKIKTNSGNEAATVKQVNYLSRRFGYDRNILARLSKKQAGHLISIGRRDLNTLNAMHLMSGRDALLPSNKQ